MAQQFNLPTQAPLSNGVVQPSSKLLFSLTGTSTPADTYTTPDLSVANSNPVVADSAGVFAPIYLDPANGRYRVIWKTSADVQLSLTDNVLSGSSSSQDYTVQGTAPFVDLIETDATANNGAWRIQANSQELSISLMNDAKSVLTNILKISSRSGTTSASLSIPGAVSFGSTVLTTATFTPTWSGFSSAPSGTIRYYLLDRFVMLVFGASNTGTSNSTSMSLTSLPSAIRPSTDASARQICILRDNSVPVVGGFGFGVSAGTLTFFMGANFSDTGFTNTGSKGLPPLTTLVYSI